MVKCTRQRISWQVYQSPSGHNQDSVILTCIFCFFMIQAFFVLIICSNLSFCSNYYYFISYSIGLKSLWLKHLQFKSSGAHRWCYAKKVKFIFYLDFLFLQFWKLVCLCRCGWCFILMQQMPLRIIGSPASGWWKLIWFIYLFHQVARKKWCQKSYYLLKNVLVFCEAYISVSFTLKFVIKLEVFHDAKKISVHCFTVPKILHWNFNGVMSSVVIFV